ncbi:MAG: hypothetical protein AABW79_03430 [Nanoarchaeota archaeon]
MEDKEQALDNLWNTICPSMESDTKPVIDIEQRDGRNLYLVGEIHGAMAPLYHIQHEIIPKMRRNPSNWLIVREGLNAYRDLDEATLIKRLPHVLYFHKVPDILGIPSADPIGSIFDRETQDKVAQGSSLSLDQIRGWCIASVIQANGDDVRNSRELDAIILEKLGVNVDEATRAIRFCYDPEAHTRLMTGWNACARKEMDKVLQSHPNRPEVLISCGIAHLPAFSDKHTYIGQREW